MPRMADVRVAAIVLHGDQKRIDEEVCGLRRTPSQLAESVVSWQVVSCGGRGLHPQPPRLGYL